MKTIQAGWVVVLLLTVSAAQAQVPKPTATMPTAASMAQPPIKPTEVQMGTMIDSTKSTMAPSMSTSAGTTTGVTDTAMSTTTTAGGSTDEHLDKAVAALNSGDKAASAKELQTGIAALEAEVQQKPTSFKDKVLAQASKLKLLLPLITGGGLSGGVLQKAVGLAKLASGSNRLESLMSAGSLVGKAGQLTSGLSGLGSAMSVLGGGASTGQSLIAAAMSGVGKLNGGSIAASAAEPAVKSQIGSVLNFVKGAL